jgi:hypothetical protein
MKGGKPTRERARTSTATGAGLRRSLVLGALILGSLALGLGLARWAAERSRPADESSPLAPSGPARVVGEPQRDRVTPPGVVAAPVKPAAAATVEAEEHDRATTPDPATRAAHRQQRAREIFQQLRDFDFNVTELSREQIEELNQWVRELAALGEDALPALGEYLREGEDVDFGLITGSEFFIYPTLRIAMLEIMIQIGGDAALALAVENLSAAKTPLELAVLAYGLERMAPGEYRQDVLRLARDELLRADGVRGSRPDPGPLFELLRTYGDSSVVPDLENAVLRWNYYATMALAYMPEGAGIPSLIRMARDPAISRLGRGDYALRMLAEVALEHPEARTALLQQAVLNQIPDSAWPSISSALAGGRLMYASRIYAVSVPSSGSPREELQQRIALIDQMLGMTRHPQAVDALQRARQLLVARLAP